MILCLDLSRCSVLICLLIDLSVLLSSSFLSTQQNMVGGDHQTSSKQTTTSPCEEEGGTLCFLEEIINGLILHFLVC